MIGRERAKPLLRVLIAWTLLSLSLHLVWEVVQLPLYTVRNAATPGSMVWAVAHCTAGDGIIGLASFFAASIWTRMVDWPWRAVQRGLPVLIVTGVAYTAFSEWRNVYVVGSWAYADAMPTVLGIGIAPLLQWLIVPTLALRFLQRRRAP